MVQTLHPGVYVIEEPAQPTIVGVSSTTGGFVGVSRWGPANQKVLISSYKQFEDLFGGPFKISGVYQQLAFAVRAFFSNGGASCYVVRSIDEGSGSPAAKATGTLSGSTDATFAAVSARYEGARGNLLQVRAVKEQKETIFTASGSGVSFFSVSDPGSFEIGDIVRIRPALGDSTFSVNNGTASPDEPYGVIAAIDTASTPNRIYVGSDAFTGTAAVGATIETSTVHRFKGTTLGAIDASSTISSITIPSGTGGNLVPGQLLVIAGLDEDVVSPGSPPVEGCEVFLRVQTVSDTPTGTVVAVSQVGTKRGSLTTIPSGSIITSVEFTIDVFEDGEFVEQHSFLSSQSDNERDFIGSSTVAGRLQGSLNESTRVALEIDGSAEDGSYIGTPLTGQPITLTSGADGATPSATEAIASIDVLSGTDDLSMLSAPDWAGNVSVQGYLADFMVAERSGMAIIDPPEDLKSGTTAVTDITAWKNNTLNKDTSFAALYWPWLVIRDPINPAFDATKTAGAFASGFGSPTIDVPPSGTVQGHYARVVFERGVQKAPANIPIAGAFDVTYRVNDPEQDVLNPNHINAIRFFPGEGIRIYGVRTLQSQTDGYHYVSTRRLMTFIEKSLQRANRFAVFEPNDPALWSVIEEVNSEFLTSIWRLGYLSPTNDVSKAFFVKCDSETTTAADQKAGRVVCLVGVQPPFPAEFIIFRLSLFDGQTDVEVIS